MNGEAYSVVVFPFLKTRSPISIGGIAFQPTDNCGDLPPEQAQSVSDIANLLFIKDDLRIRSASFAIVPKLNVQDQASPDMIRLVQLQSAVSFLYGSPHPVNGDVFLTLEHASIAIFNRERVSVYLVRPQYNAESISEDAEPATSGHGYVPGFAGLYNFRHHFWVAQGSRLYGPQPQIMLNIAQDLSEDIATASSNSPYLGLLFDLLDEPQSRFSMRIFAAIKWFNGANRSSVDAYESIVNLSIAFESLLALPQTEKSDRLVDSISLLLGRVPRLQSWARQFYDARSRIVHEGGTNQLHFVVADDSAKSAGSVIY